MDGTKTRRVLHGARSDARRLCDSCSYSTIIKGAAESQERVFCSQVAYNGGASDGILPFRVVECTGYSDKTAPSIRRMEETAWILETKNAGRQVGFLSARDWRKSNPTEDVTHSR